MVLTSRSSTHNVMPKGTQISSPVTKYFFRWPRMIYKSQNSRAPDVDRHRRRLVQDALLVAGFALSVLVDPLSPLEVSLALDVESLVLDVTSLVLVVASLDLFGLLSSPPDLSLVLGLALFLKSVTYQPLPLSWKPA